MTSQLASRPDVGAPNDLRNNALLASLDAEVLEQLARKLTVEQVGEEGVARHPALDPDCIYFPLTAVLALRHSIPGSPPVAVLTVGREGALRLEALIDDASDSVSVTVLVPGKVAMIPLAALTNDRDGLGDAMRALGQRYLPTLVDQLARELACRRLHDPEPRTASMLLRCADQLRSDSIWLTQESLAEVMGVRRAAVNAAAGMLQREGAMRYRRGRIRILDRAALERAACGCYAAQSSARTA